MYGAGLSNQRMSLDMGVALSIYSGRAFAPYDFKRLVHSGRVLQGQLARYNITELFELPVPMLDEEASFVPWSSLASKEFSPDHLGRHIFVDETLVSDQRFQEFLGRRKLTVTDLNVMYEDLTVLNLASQRNFCNVAPMFYVKEELRNKILHAVRKVIPREIYREVALEIAESIGFFNAIHVRQGDFLNTDHPFDIKDPESLLSSVDGIFERDKTLVICSDEEASPNFALLREHFECVMLESYILETPSLRQIYDDLPLQDEAIMGLICQLVCEHADRFAGSLRSTYTNYVHRARGEVEMLFINTLERPNVKITEGRFEITQADKEFSWWRTGWCMDVDPSTIAWMREWPEVFA
jgi:hypothetical protein